MTTILKKLQQLVADAPERRRKEAEERTDRYKRALEHAVATVVGHLIRKAECETEKDGRQSYSFDLSDDAMRLFCTYHFCIADADEVAREVCARLRNEGFCGVAYTGYSSGGSMSMSGRDLGGGTWYHNFRFELPPN